ncbi:MAG TPA: hypothetical protein VF678_01760 [bacterium]
MALVLCPRCQSQRTRVIRTTPDREFPAADVIRQCRKPECGAIFSTHEALVEIFEKPSDAQLMRGIESLVDQLSPAARKSARSLIERLAVAAIPASLPPATRPARRSA